MADSTNNNNNNNRSASGSDADDTEGYFTAGQRQAAGDAGNNNSTSGGLHGSQGANNRSGLVTSQKIGKSFNAGDSMGDGAGDRAGKLRRETQLPLKFVMDRLRHGVDSSELYTDMLVFVPFLVLFIFFFLAGRDIEANFYVLQGMRDRIFWSEYPSVESQVSLYREQVLNNERLWIELDKDYPSIGNGGDWNDWFSTVLVPTLFDCQHPDTAYTFNAPIGQNYLVGALRVRTQRALRTSCDVRKDLYPLNETKLNRVCYGRSGSENEDTSSLYCNVTNPINGQRMYEYKPCDDVPGAPTSAIEGLYHCGGFMFDIPFNATCNQARAVAGVLANGACPFVDNWATRFVMSEFFMYTPALDSFHAVKLFSEVDVAGSWLNQWVFRSFRVWTDTAVLQTIIDVCFLLFVLYYCVDFFIQLKNHVKRDGHAVVSYFAQFWTILELVNMVTFLVVFGFRFSWMSVSDKADSLRLPMANRYPENLDRLMVLFEAQVYGNSVNTMFVFLKLLKYVRLNPRLNVLPRTIAACQQSIVGVLVLFFTIILGYAITGWTLFGVNVERFRNLGVSISSLTRMLVGDIDYEELRNENRFLAGAFFWSYMILALFLLLNFLIAIISESFAQVSGKAFSTPFEELLLRWWQNFRAYMRPSNLARLCGNSLRGKDEAVLLRRIIQDMEIQYDMRFEALLAAKRGRRQAQQEAFLAEGKDEWAEFVDRDDDDDDDEELEVLVRFDDLPYLMGDEEYEDLGEHYWTYTWEALMNEHDDARKSSEEVTKRRMAETVQLGVEKVLGDDLSKIDQLDTALKSVENEVARMLGALES